MDEKPMAGQVTALKIQARNKNRVNVFLNDEYAFALDLSLALPLKVGQQLSDLDVEELQTRDQNAKAYNSAVRLLAQRPRSQAEIEQRLQSKKHSSLAITYAIERLLSEGYLNDPEFARFWIEDRSRFRPRSARALRYELRQKGLANDVIDEALVELDEEALAWSAVENKLERWRLLDREEFKAKLIGHLARRGFGYQTAMTAYERACRNLEDEDSF